MYLRVVVFFNLYSMQSILLRKIYFYVAVFCKEPILLISMTALKTVKYMYEFSKKKNDFWYLEPGPNRNIISTIF